MITQEIYRKYASDPSVFRNDLLVDVDGIVHKFGEVMDPWQIADFSAMDPALQRCNGREDTGGPNRIYLERPRGHSKTTDLAVTCTWALAFATRPIRGYCYAADKDQASVLKDAIATILRLNPWLSEILDAQRGMVKNIAAGHPGQDGTCSTLAEEGDRVIGKDFVGGFAKLSVEYNFFGYGKANWLDFDFGRIGEGFGDALHAIGVFRGKRCKEGDRQRQQQADQHPPGSFLAGGSFTGQEIGAGGEDKG